MVLRFNVKQRVALQKIALEMLRTVNKLNPALFLTNTVALVR